MNQEEIWAKELRESRLKFIERVKLSLHTPSPTKRYAMYHEWRKEIGDVAAREQARFSEAVREGRVSLNKLEDMVDK